MKFKLTFLYLIKVKIDEKNHLDFLPLLKRNHLLDNKPM